MPYTYPPAPATLTGDTLAASRFLNSPTLVARYLRDIATQRFIADRLLSQRFSTASGSVVYETGESIYTDDAPTGVTPGSEYPLTTVSNGDASIAKTVKWGQDVEITDEAIARQNFNPVNRAVIKMVNTMVKTVDGVAMSAINSAVTQSIPATASWKSKDADIFLDIELAIAKIDTQNQGYAPDVLVVDPTTFAYLKANPRISQMIPRESTSATVFTDRFPVISGLTIMSTTNALPGTAFVADTTALGGMADENIGGPGYVAAGGGIQVKTMRQDEEDRWRLRCRRITVPIVQEPPAACKITGVAA